MRRDPLPATPCCYLLVELLPDVLPLPIEPELEPIEPDEEPVLGVVVLGDVVDEPLVPPLLELEPDLLKCASHSEREIWPSLLVSTDEKLGCDWLPELELGELVLDEDVPPLADGEAADGLDEDGLDEDEEESAATAASERAKSAAAVVTVTVLIMEWSSMGWGSPHLLASSVPRPRREGKLLT